MRHVSADIVERQTSVCVQEALASTKDIYGFLFVIARPSSMELRPDTMGTLSRNQSSGAHQQSVANLPSSNTATKAALRGCNDR